jgi:hypothetical protein
MKNVTDEDGIEAVTLYGAFSGYTLLFIADYTRHT